MIYHFASELTDDEISLLSLYLDEKHPCAPHFIFRGAEAVVLSCGMALNIPDSLKDKLIATYDTAGDYQLSSRHYKASTVTIPLRGITIGNGTDTALIAGPCSVEDATMIDSVADTMHREGLHILRAGCYKPRTSIYSFQGLGSVGIDMLLDIRQRYNLLICTEVCAISQLDDVLRVADIVQIGAKSMYDYDLLRACSQIDRPVLLKRHYGSRLEEFAKMAETLMVHGKENIILCERGIRTHETSTRFTLDLCGVEWLRRNLRLPIFADPSHAMGEAYGVEGLACAAMAQGVDGIMIETHPEPHKALSDSKQQLTLDQFRQLHGKLNTIAHAIGKQIL